MEKDLLIALLTCVGTFFVLLFILYRLNRIFSIEIPGFLGFIIGLAVIAGLYIKRDFFFGGNPVITGVTIGAILALLWNIRYTRFMDAVLGMIISFRFLFWAAATAAGIYKKAIVVNLWNKYIVLGAQQLRPYMLVAVILLYIAGTVFLLFPEFYIRNTKKNEGFTFNKRVSRSRKIFTQVAGTLIILICAPLLPEAVLFIYLLFT